MESYVNRKLVFLTIGEFFIAIYRRRFQIIIHLHADGFDKLLRVNKYGVSIE